MLYCRLCDLHELYGPAVRVAQNEIIFFSDTGVWKDIYKRCIAEHGGKDENDKWIIFFSGNKDTLRSILSTLRAEHTYLRQL